MADFPITTGHGPLQNRFAAAGCSSRPLRQSPLLFGVKPVHHLGSFHDLNASKTRQPIAKAGGRQ
jgi:hypothetical protein